MKNYFTGLERIFSALIVTDRKRKILSPDEAISKIISLIANRVKKSNKLIFIGNGGSASIASHMVTDFLKNLKIAAIAFNDPSLITCISNDLGYEYVFEKPLELLVQRGDVLFSISSSGMSKNILNATLKARKKGCFIITLSGFSKNNSLKKIGDINFYLPCNSYGYVEISHLVICHCIADRLMKGK